MSLLLEFHSDKIELHTPTSTSQQFQSAYLFCKEWLSGQQRFFVKTSGSTGSPKSILLTRGQLEFSARNLGNSIGYQLHDEMHIVINVNSIGGLMQIVRAICYQMNVYIYEPKVDVVEGISIEAGKRAHISLVTPMLDYVLQSNKKALNRFTTILVGGSKLGEINLSGIDAQLYETYGMTETASNVALKHLNNHETTFKLLPHWNLKLHNDHCLALYHPAITYDWINTNDVVEFAEDLSFNILGRTDFVINCGGKKYHPESIENQLNTLSFLANTDFAISAEPHEVWNQSMVLVLVDQEGLPTDKEILEEINHVLGSTIIRKVVRISALPLNEYGKLNRMQLLKNLSIEH